MNPTARRFARHYALQALYQWQLAEANANEIEAEFVAHQIKKKTDLDFFKELLHEVPKQCSELDEQFAPFLSRPINEIDPIELTVLRIGTYELKNRLDVPYRVVINESLELTKKFGSIEGFKFVNGVLEKVARQLRSVEMAAAKK